MKSFVYTFEDDTFGLSLIVESELIDFEDGNAPNIMITDISHCDISLEQWCFSDRFIGFLQDKTFQQWCKEGTNHA